MVEIKIRNKILEAVSYSRKSHLKTDDLIPLNKIKIDTSTKITHWSFNGKYESGNHYIQFLCSKCHKNLFSSTTTRLIKEIKTEVGEISFICRSCSAKKNAEKVDIIERNKVRRKNWNNKTDKERKEFGEAISRGRLKYANITDKKIEEAISAYVEDEMPLSTIINILGISNKNTAKIILNKNGIETRNFSEAKSIYFKKNPELNPAKSPEARAKISKRLKENPRNRGRNSKIEQIFYEKINENKKQHQYIKNKQFDVLIDDHIYIEFDGTYWHGKTRDYYDFNQISNILNDEIKNKLIIQNKKSLYRVWSDEDFQEYTLNEIKDKAYYIIEDGIIVKDNRNFSNLIITHKYISDIVEKYPSDIENNLGKLALFVQVFYSFPYMKNSERLEDVVKKIRKNNTKQLSSAITTGNNFLKSRFKSFYYASKGNKLSMFDAYYDYDELLKIIKNRLGITYKEKWDLTPEVIRRGFISNYYSVSFFNPVIAYKIFNIIAKPSDIILDMSAGFGGRMLGWYAFQNNGKYIAYEPNTKTFNELVEFSYELNSNIELYNKPFEESINHKVDICFSCPPYFNTETYSNEESQSIIKYKTYEEWINWLKNCIVKMKEMSDRVYLVVNNSIYKDIGGEIIQKIKNNGSHFTKKLNYELLIKL